jgi:hypothetical protein
MATPRTSLYSRGMAVARRWRGGPRRWRSDGFGGALMALDRLLVSRRGVRRWRGRRGRRRARGGGARAVLAACAGTQAASLCRAARRGAWPTCTCVDVYRSSARVQAAVMAVLHTRPRARVGERRAAAAANVAACGAAVGARACACACDSARAVAGAQAWRMRGQGGARRAGRADRGRACACGGGWRRPSDVAAWRAHVRAHGRPGRHAGWAGGMSVRAREQGGCERRSGPGVLGKQGRRGSGAGRA